jgi:hypothetical protein
MTEISDERLIDHALGLEDDPELVEELAQSEELRGRLQLLEADLRQIDAELHGVLPTVPDGWADLSSAHWRRLQPFLELPEPRRSRSLRSRLLAPALTLLIVAALLVGLFSLRGAGTQTSSTTAHGPAYAPESAPVPSALRQAVGGLAAGYRQVVVAQAGAAQAGRQPYEVLRVLKGPALSTFTVDLGSETGVPESSLQIVYLDPVSGTKSGTSQPQAALGSGAAANSAGPSDQGSGFGAGGTTLPSPQPVTYNGKPALVQPLPSGIDPNTLTAPR